MNLLQHGGGWSVHLYGWLGMLPLFGVLLIGLWMCAGSNRWPRHTRVFLGTAIVVQLFCLLALPTVSTMIFHEWFTHFTDFRTRMLIQSVIVSIPHALVWGLVLWSVRR